MTYDAFSQRMQIPKLLAVKLRYPKIYVADFCHYKRFFGHVFRKKNAIWFSENEGGGGQRPFGIFPKVHPFWWCHPSLSIQSSKQIDQQWELHCVLSCLRELSIQSEKRDFVALDMFSVFCKTNFSQSTLKEEFIIGRDLQNFESWIFYN